MLSNKHAGEIIILLISISPGFHTFSGFFVCFFLSVGLGEILFLVLELGLLSDRWVLDYFFVDSGLVNIDI